MNFTKAESNETFALRLTSDTGLWSLGYHPVRFGVRVCLSRAGNNWFTLNYSAGDDAGFALLLLAVVAKILEAYPEDVPPDQIERDFPKYQVKPISIDACWGTLQRMAGIEPVPSVTCLTCQRTTYDSKADQLETCPGCHYPLNLSAKLPVAG